MSPMSAPDHSSQVAQLWRKEWGRTGDLHQKRHPSTATAPFVDRQAFHSIERGGGAFSTPSHVGQQPVGDPDAARSLRRRHRLALRRPVKDAALDVDPRPPRLPARSSPAKCGSISSPCRPLSTRTGRHAGAPDARSPCRMGHPVPPQIPEKSRHLVAGEEIQNFFLAPNPITGLSNFLSGVALAILVAFRL